MTTGSGADPAADGQRSVSSFGDDALGDRDAVGLAAAVAAGEVSPAELVEAAIGRADKVQPQLNAVAVTDYERARAKAEAFGDPSSRPGSVFDGVPSFVKGVAEVAGLPNRFGSRAVPDKPADESSPTVVQLESTGLVSLGLTTTPEFGLTASTEALVTGITRNPWSLDHSPGGSSGGSAALVAAGVVPVAHANDGGGSIRIPASCCGLVGLKPSRGRMARIDLPNIIPVDLAAEGIVSRSVRDTATYLHGAELHRRAAELPSIGHVTSPSDRRLRVGVVTERVDGVPLDSVNRSEVLRVAGQLEALGHDVELIPNPFPARFADDFMMLWAYAPFLLSTVGKRVMGPEFDRKQLEPWTQWLVSHFRRRAAKAPAAFRRMRRLVAEFGTAFAAHDVLLSSTLGGPLHEIGYLSPELPGEVHLARAIAHCPTTPPYNVGGGPAVSLPLAVDGNGLPMGIHFGADVGQEAMLLELAFELEAAHPWPTLAGGG
ncbi:MAG: amidase [Actinomycetota bacterium]